MTEEFKRAIADYGLTPPEHITPGKWERFPGRGKSGKNKSAACFLFPNLQGGVYGDHSSGDFNGNGCQVWRAERVKEYSPAELIDFERMVREAQKKAEKEQSARYKKKAKEADEYVKGLGEASPRQKYFKDKGFKPIGPVKKDGQKIILPLFNQHNQITTYQEIYPDGRKNFFYGGQKGGSAFPIPGSTDIVYLCEGYSTGATIHDLTGSMVVVCIDAGNMKKVASWACERFERLIIAADNDHHQRPKWIADGKKGKDPGEGGIGIRIAKEICREHSNIDWIAPPKIEGAKKGTDWNDCFIAFGKEETKKQLFPEYQKRLSVEEIKKEDTDKTLQIPKSLWEDKGLISLGMDAASRLSAIDIVQYNFPLIISTISTALAGNICFGQVHPSCFFIKIGSTSTGKSQTDRALRRVISPLFETPNQNNDVFNSFYGITDFASGPGLLRSVSKNSRSMINVDEITYLFSAGLSGKADPTEKQKISAILELSTSAGDRMERAYSDNGNNIVINQAIVNMIGNATPLIFKALSLEDFQSGLVQRFDFFSYGGDIPYRKRLPDLNADIGKLFAEKIYALKNIEKPNGRYDMITNAPINIGIEKKAESKLMEFSKSVIDAANDEKDEGIKGIISRRYDAASKFALIHAGATREKEIFFKPLKVKDLDYGIELADLLAEWKINVLTGKISSGKFDSDCSLFLEGAKAAISVGKAPTWNAITRRRKALKNLNPREIDDIVEALKRNSSISIDDSGKVPQYFPLEDIKE